MANKLFTALVKQIRKLVLSFSEPDEKVAVDEHVLEHLLLYHGLVGSSPENQRSFREVKAEIRIAAENRNPLQMGIALKLPPLWWEDKLRTIFGELREAGNAERAIEALHPVPNDSQWPTRLDPLGHNDWNVRANAASLLAFLDARNTVDRICASLTDSASNAKSAFPHIAYALGRLGADQGRKALEQFLLDEEPWFRVDVAGALAHWPLPVVGETLMQCMLSYHQLSDYVAVAIARRHSPGEFLASTHPAAQDGACAMVLGLLDASKQTFSNDVIFDSGLLACTKDVFASTISSPSAIKVQAALSLAQWLRANPEAEDMAEHGAPAIGDLDALEASITTQLVQKVVMRSLSITKTVVPPDSTELRHAIALAGDFHITSALPILMELLSVDNPLLDPTIEALAKINDPGCADALVALGKELVSTSQRTSLPLSKQPVAEENARHCNSYWYVLKSLGETGALESLPYLLQACSDYAPDKREQALKSVFQVYSKQNKVPEKYHSLIRDAAMQALSDPSAQMRACALDGLDEIEIGTELFITQVVKLVESHELSVSRKAKALLERLCQSGHKAAVTAALSQAINANSGNFQQSQLQALLDQISKST